MLTGRIRKKLLTKVDDALYHLLLNDVNIMPMRLVKLVAFFYTDARVREGTYGNLGFRIVSDDYRTRVLIGKNVSIAPNVVMIACSSANNGKKINEIRYVKEHLWKEDRIVIADDVWIGANVTILPGVSVGKCSVIGAGSVVTKNVEPYTIVAGNPARVIRRLNEKE